MSVTTEADKKLEIVKESLDTALENIFPIVRGKAWGADNFTDDTRRRFKEVMLLMMDALDKIS